MQTSVRINNFRAEEFANLAISPDPILANLRLEHLRLVFVSDDGTQIALMTTDAAERVADKRHLGEIAVSRGWQAITVLDKRPGSELLIGSAGVDRNPEIASVLAGLKTLLEREGDGMAKRNIRCCYVGCSIAGQRCYMLKTGAPFFTDVSAEVDAVEIAYVPGAKGYLARRNAQSNQVGFLLALEAGEGSFSANSWRSIAVPGMKYITGIQPRITRASAVMIHGVNNLGQSVTLAVNLEEIVAGRIKVDADVPTAVGLKFGGMVSNDVAQIQVERSIPGLPQGVNLVHVNQLPELFGPAAEQFAPVAAG